MLLLPSTTNHTVGVTGEVLCVPCAQLSFGPFGRVVVLEAEPEADAPAAPLLPTTKLPPGVDGVVGLDPVPPGELGDVPADALVLGETPLRFAVGEPSGLPLQAATRIKPTSSAGIE